MVNRREYNLGLPGNDSSESQIGQPLFFSQFHLFGDDDSSTAANAKASVLRCLRGESCKPSDTTPLTS